MEQEAIKEMVAGSKESWQDLRKGRETCEARKETTIISNKMFSLWGTIIRLQVICAKNYEKYFTYITSFKNLTVHGTNSF